VHRPARRSGYALPRRLSPACRRSANIRSIFTGLGTAHNRLPAASQDVGDGIGIQHRCALYRLATFTAGLHLVAQQRLGVTRKGHGGRR